MNKSLILLCTLLIPLTSATVGYDEINYGVHWMQEADFGNITKYYYNYTINGSILALNDISDVQAPSPSDGESLVWSSSLSRWIAEEVISRWTISNNNNFLYNDSDTLYFNETLLNNTIDARAASVETDFHIFINSSSYNNVNHNITAGDADDVEFVIVPGKKFIFGDTLT